MAVNQPILKTCAVRIIKFPSEAIQHRPYAILDSEFRTLVAGPYGSRRIAKRELARVRKSHPDAKLWVSLTSLVARLEAIDHAIGKSRRADLSTNHKARFVGVDTP